MKVTKLSWATIEVSSEDVTILIDPLNSTPKDQDKMFVAQLGDAKEEIYKLINLKKPDVILITHLHPDHFDPRGIIESFGYDVPIYGPMSAESYIKKLGFRNVFGVELHKEYRSGNMVFSPTYAVDGFGSEQVAWVVKDKDNTIIHCGDTLWHGYWWKIEAQFGPIDCAFMPANGPVLNVRGLKKQSSLQACLTPEEAVEASYLLGAKSLVPIHFNTFHNPPYYIETPEVVNRLQNSADKRGIELHVLNPGEGLAL